MQFFLNFIYCIFSFLSMIDIFSKILHNCTKFFFLFFMWISVHNYHLSVARTSVRTATMMMMMTMMMMKYLKYTVKKLLVKNINFTLFFFSISSYPSNFLSSIFNFLIIFWMYNYSLFFIIYLIFLFLTFFIFIFLYFSIFWFPIFCYKFFFFF